MSDVIEITDKSDPKPKMSLEHIKKLKRMSQSIQLSPFKRDSTTFFATDHRLSLNPTLTKKFTQLETVVDESFGFIDDPHASKEEIKQGDISKIIISPKSDSSKSSNYR